ncbi:sulfurtransferase [Sanguibacter suarezii]|uniref:sulfurtransferase n=1 Tax=Sanguibacter suarezii TaxID=60921 RepID=UPI000831853D|nr:rhodanese-like domain-containing protein [Sanguibacter suarezii]
MTARPLVDAAWLAARLDDPTLVLLDVTVDLPRPLHDGDHRSASGRPGWAAAHIPVSQHLDLLHDFADPEGTFHFAHPPVDHARGVLSGLGISDGSTVVLYDSADGFWSARAWWSLRGLGLHALVLDGGLTAWQGAGHPVQTADAAGSVPGQQATTGSPVGAAGDRTVSGEVSGDVAPGGSLTLVEDPSVWASREDVLDIVAGRRSAALVCALGADQFTGEATTRYSRRGHIPTSVNLSARDLAHEAGRLLPAPVLARVVGQALPEEDGEVVLYCGGGISASYAALGLVSAGRTRVRVYDGSLEEWSADPDLPLVLPST